MNWVVSEFPKEEIQAATPVTEVSTTLPTSFEGASDAKHTIEQLKEENAKLLALLTQIRAAACANSPQKASPAKEGVVPRDFVPGEHSVVFVCTSNQPEEAKDEKKNGAFVAVMDVNDDDWWEIIDPEKDNALQQPELIDSDYVMVEDKQVFSALSKFVASTLKGYPESKAVSPTQLKRMLDQTFSTLQEKGTLAKVYDWASFAYTSYGWATYGWALYQDPTMLKMIAKWSFSAATWMMFLL